MNIGHSTTVDQQLLHLGLELGHLYGDLIQTGKHCQRKSYLDYQNFIGDFFQEKPQYSQIQRLDEALTDFLQAYAQSGASPITLKSLRDYSIAQTIRHLEYTNSELTQDWFYLCRLEAIPQPGSYVTAVIFQESIVLIRQADRSVRGFLNVCPHRHSTLFHGSGCLSKQALAVCPYHGWTFKANGQCSAIPGSSHGEFGHHFDAAHYRLQSVPIQVVDQGVFIRFDETFLPREPVGNSPGQADNGLSVAAQIAQLLHKVDAADSEICTPQIPYWLRWLLRVGCLACFLPPLICQLPPGYRRSVSDLLSCEAWPDSEGLVCQTYLMELKQLMLSLQRQGIQLDYGEICDRITKSIQLQALPTIHRPAEPLPPVPEALQPLGQTRETLAPWVYTSSELFALETHHILKHSWQFVCHQNEIPAVGTYTCLDTAGERVYVIRTAADNFFAGTLSDLSLVHQRPDFTRSDYGLRAVPLTCSRGFLFICLSDSSAALVWPLDNVGQVYDWENLHPLTGPGWLDFYVEANYKILWENFNEAYHFPMTHLNTVRLYTLNETVCPLKEKPANNLTPERRQYFECITAAASHDRERESALIQQLETAGKLTEPLQYTYLNVVPDQTHSPTFFGVSVFPEHLQVMVFEPMGPQSCYVKSRVYGKSLDITTDQGRLLKRAQILNAHDIQVQITVEDIPVCYSTQTGVRSKVFKSTGILCNLEMPINDFQQTLRQRLPVTRCRQAPTPGTVGHLNQILKASLPTADTAHHPT